MDLKKETNECAFNIKAEIKGICMDDDTVSKLVDYASTKNLDVKDGKDKIIDGLKKELNCNSESCLLTKTEIRDAIGHDVAEKQLNSRFKPEGPFDSNEWFSNVNIDEVLNQIVEKYKEKKFLHIEFQMRDFERTGGKLSRIDLAKEYSNNNVRCFGVVFNTDVSSGRGQHWFSIFGDFHKEPFTIEYFNSTGQGPLPEILTWMKKTKHHMEITLNKKVDDVIVSTIQNQVDNHSCGSYSLYYIISRLEGISHKHFTKNKIGDETMHIFRRHHLFRQTKQTGK